ncbi:MAG: flagellar hook-length control protein FliK [Gammaproteobacteria bacterium]|nr:MAG: flagellar hook-length control protein FliK [Gammaproteobacteria bacterium]
MPIVIGMVWEVDRLVRPSMGNVTVPGKIPEGFVVSQLVEAKATTDSKNNQVELEMNEMKFIAETDKAISKGEKLLLKVVETGNKLTFAVLPKPEQLRLNLINKLLLAAVPKQNSIAPLVKSLAELIKSPELLLKAISQQQSQRPASQNTDIRPDTQTRALMQTVRQLVDSLPTQQQISNGALRAESVKSFIKNSGVFFEQRLAGSSPAERTQIISSDVKANLVKINNELTRLMGGPEKTAQQTARAPSQPAHLSEVQHTNAKVDAILSQYLKASGASSLKPDALQQQLQLDPHLKIIPPPLPNFPLISPGATAKKENASLEGMLGINKLLAELKNQTESSLARLELSQSNLAAKDRPVHLTLDIPVMDDQGASVFHLRIKEDEKKSDKTQREAKEAGWTVELAFNIDPLGTVNTRIKLGSSKVSTTFWAENESTAAKISQLLPLLNSKLSSLGLDVDTMTCFNGVPPQPDHITSDGGLIDEKA